MKAFSDLYRRLDSATSIRAKQAALVEAFAAAKDDPMQWASAAWMVYFLAGGKPRQTVPTRLLLALAVEGSGLPEWLSRSAIRTSAIWPRRSSLLLPEGDAGEEVSLDVWMRERLLAVAFARRGGALRAAQALGRGTACRPATRLLQADHRRTAGRRVAAAGREGAGRGRGRRGEPNGAAHDRLRPGAAHAVRRRFPGADRRGRACRRRGARRGPALSVLSGAVLAAAGRRTMPATLGPPANWIVEWKFDGIRAQLLKRGEAWRLWSRGEELISEAYPDLEPLARALPSGVGARRRARRPDSAARAMSRRFARRSRAFRQPAAEARPQGRQREDHARVAGRLHRLRSARKRGPGHPRRAAA